MIRNERDLRPGNLGRPLVRAFVAMLVLGLGAAIAPTPTAAATDATIKPVSYWEQQYSAVAATNLAENRPLSLSSDSWDYYNLAYAIDANVSMFEATAKTPYLDQALAYANNMVSKAKPSSTLGARAFRDKYLGWVSQRSDVAGTEVPLFESYAWRYVARMLRVMHDSPQVFGNAAYRQQYDQLENFTEVNIFDKWMSRGANSYVYRSNTHMASHWAYIALEIARLTTDPARRTAARAVVDNVDLHMPNYKGTSLKGQMHVGTVSAGAYFWTQNWGSTARPGQDVAHGNAVISYVTEALDIGSTWTAADMTAFSRTLTDLVMPKAASVDGSGVGTGWLADGFVKLGRYSVAVQLRLETHAVRSQAQYMATMAVNARRLTDPSSAPPPTTPAPSPAPPTTPAPTPAPPTTPVPPTAPAPKPQPPHRPRPHKPHKPHLAVSVGHTTNGPRAVLRITAQSKALRPGRQLLLQRLRAGHWRTVSIHRAQADRTGRFRTIVLRSGTARFRVRATATASSPLLTSVRIVLRFAR